jgi:hypothetical protein
MQIFAFGALSQREPFCPFFAIFVKISDFSGTPFVSKVVANMIKINLLLSQTGSDPPPSPPLY